MKGALAFSLGPWRLHLWSPLLIETERDDDGTFWIGVSSPWSLSRGRFGATGGPTLVDIWTFGPFDLRRWNDPFPSHDRTGLVLNDRDRP